MSVGKIFAWVVLSPLVLIVLGVVLANAYYEHNKAYWDNKVRELCEKDGGVTVFERIELTREEFRKLGGNQYGQIPVPDKSFNRQDYPYFSERSTISIREGDPSVYMYESKLFRRSDQKLLGLMIDYGRGGGDFPTGIGHPSHFGCADLRTVRLDIERQIFTVKEEKGDRFIYSTHEK